MKINLARTPVQNILDLVKDANPLLTLTEAQFTLSAPAVVAGTAGRNTEVTLTAVVGQGKTGTKTVAYTRLDPVTGPNEGAATTGVEVAGDATAAAIKAQLVALFGVLADEVDVADLVLPTEGVDGSINLVADADSLLYVGTSAVVLKLQAEEQDLGTEITQSDLNGFEPETV